MSEDVDLLDDMIAAGVPTRLVARVVSRIAALETEVGLLRKRRETDAKRQKEYRERHVTSRDANGDLPDPNVPEMPGRHVTSRDVTGRHATSQTVAESQEKRHSGAVSGPETVETRHSLSSYLLPGEPLKEGSASKEACSGRAKYDDAFESGFWKPYPRTVVMSKKEAFAQWLRMSLDDRVKACSAIDPFKRFLNDNPDHPVVHACRFLSQRRFDGFAEAAPSDDGRPPNVPADIPPEQWQDYLGGWRPGMITSRQRKEQHDAYERALNGGVDNSQELSPAGIVVRQITEGQAQ